MFKKWKKIPVEKVNKDCDSKRYLQHAKEEDYDLASYLDEGSCNEEEEYQSICEEKEEE